MNNSPWIETRNGVKFHFLEPLEDEILLEDIAYALSQQCRYSGHCSRFYSVAEHCVLVSALLPARLKMAGLFHDAAEAYLTDLPKPVKDFFPDYKVMEDRLMEAIARKFDIEGLDDPLVKAADTQQLSTEAHYLMPSQGNDWYWGEGRPEIDKARPPLGLAPRDAYGLFMATFDILSKPPAILIPETVITK